MSLAALIRKGGLAKVATAIPAIPATQQGKAATTVASPTSPEVASLPDPAMETRRQRVTPEVELTALVNLIADHHGFTPSDRQEALEIALADSISALECFRALAARLPGCTAEGPPC